jgi:hypothetical protein
VKAKKPEWDVARHTQKESCPLARNEVARITRERKGDFLLMLDDDVVPSDMIFDWPKLDLPVIGMLAPCYKEGGFAWNAANVIGPDLLSTVATPVHDPEDPLQFHPVFLMGTAVMMIRRDVLEDERLWPLFEHDLYPDGTRRPYGAEDYYFCRKLWDCGVPVHMATCLARHFVEMDMVEVLASINAHVVDQNVRPPYLLTSALSDYSARDGKPFDHQAVANYLDYSAMFDGNRPNLGQADSAPQMVKPDIQELRKDVGRGIRHNA